MKGVKYAYYFCINKGYLFYCKYFLLNLAGLLPASGQILKQRFQSLALQIKSITKMRYLEPLQLP